MCLREKQTGRSFAFNREQQSRRENGQELIHALLKVQLIFNGAAASVAATTMIHSSHVRLDVD